MAKYYGRIGFGTTYENVRGIYGEEIVYRYYSGDVIRNNRKLLTEEKVNPDLSVSNEISILADPYAVQNFHSIRCAEYLNSKWTVTNVRVEYPRLVLSLGSIYNETDIDR